MLATGQCAGEITDCDSPSLGFAVIELQARRMPMSPARVAALRNRHDIGAEAFAVDRAVEDARRRELVATQGAQEGQRSPVAMRRKARQAMALRPPSAKRGHAGLDPGLVDKHQMPWIETCLP
jgi:hypothetical protein